MMNGSSPAPRALPSLRLNHPSGSSTEIYLQGAHVASWIPPSGTDVLFMSRESLFEAGVPIRGGIPVVFPQFSSRGPLPKHGFARTEQWHVEEQGTEPGGAAYAHLSLADSAATRELWPHPFLAELYVRLSDSLTTTLRVTNTGEQPFTFTTALHTYFLLGDVREARVEGLEGSRFLGTEPGAAPRAFSTPITVEGETDGVYAGAADRLLIRDPSLERSIVIEKTGFPDAVVWNPWIDKAREMPDFGDEEYLTMICVEPGSIAEPVRLAPGERWSGTQTLRVEAGQV